MPEGDTVYLSARRMHAALAGHRIVASDFRLPRLATADVSGRAVLEVVPRGKHMLIRFDDGRTLHTHFRLDGSWRIQRLGQGRRGRAYDLRVVLRTGDREALGYRLHDVELLATSAESRVVGHLGPDLLDPACDLAEAVRRLCRQPAREVGAALLDQRSLAGIGNLYKSEVLFLRGLSPWTPVAEVTDPLALVTLAQRLLLANRDHWEQVTTGRSRRGEEHWVFERPGRPCRRCGTPIRVADQATPPFERLTYWCPSCQPGPASRR